MDKESMKEMLINLKNHLYAHENEYLVIQNHSRMGDDELDTEIDYDLDVNMINLLLNALGD